LPTREGGNPARRLASLLPDRADPISKKLHGSLCGFQWTADQVVTRLLSGDVIHGNHEPPAAEVDVNVGSLGDGNPPIHRPQPGSTAPHSPM
jgi:hypothetical protein